MRVSAESSGGRSLSRSKAKRRRTGTRSGAIKPRAPTQARNQRKTTEQLAYGPHSILSLIKRFGKRIWLGTHAASTIGGAIGLIVLIGGLIGLANQNDDEESSRATPSRPVEIEGALSVANVTAGDTEYSDAPIVVNTGDLIELSAYYYNRENVDSGLYAAELEVRFELPETRSTAQTARVYITSSNSNDVVSSVSVTVPRYNVLNYVSGSAKWTHNETGKDINSRYITEKVSDTAVTNGVLLEDAPPCLKCEAYVTIQARVELG